MYHHTQLIFVFLVEIRFHHVGQAGFELLTSNDQPILASQSAGFTGLSYRARPLKVDFSQAAFTHLQNGKDIAYLERFGGDWR